MGIFSTVMLVIVIVVSVMILAIPLYKILVQIGSEINNQTEQYTRSQFEQEQREISQCPSGQCIPYSKGVLLTMNVERDNPQTVPAEMILRDRFTWAQLEPADDQYNWSWIENLKNKNNGKNKIVLNFIPTSGDLDIDCNCPDKIWINDGLPEFVLNDPNVDKVGDFDTPDGHLAKYPVFWDAEYLSYLEDFINDFAAEYDGDPYIEFIFIGGYQTQSGEANGYRKGVVYLKEDDCVTPTDPKKLPYYGLCVTGRTYPADSPLTDATIEIMNMWNSAFNKTPLAFTFHGTDESEYSGQANNAALERKFMMFNTGLNERDKTEMRERYSGWRADYEVKVGWAGLTNMGENATILDAYKEGIGIPNEKEPLSQVSYVAMAYDEQGGGLTEEQEEARTWAYPRLLI